MPSKQGDLSLLDHPIAQELLHSTTFGINLSTQAGAFIASATAAANFGVTVRWPQSSKETTPTVGSK